MPATYYALVTIHVLAALVWLGGMFFLALVGAPVLRALEPPELRQRLFADLGIRARAVGWWSIAVLVVSGTLLLDYRGLLARDVLGDARFWASGLGMALAAKLTAVATMLVVSFVHDFILGPAAGKVAAGTPAALRLRRRAALLARGSAIVGIVIVVAAVRLARGA